jgi:hypothetical protein
MTPPAPATEEPTSPHVAIEVARLTGRIDQVIVDHERRLASLEAKSATGGARAAAIASPWLAAVALVIALASKVQWT